MFSTCQTPTSGWAVVEGTAASVVSAAPAVDAGASVATGASVAADDGSVVAVLPDATAEVAITSPTSDKVAAENRTTRRRIAHSFPHGRPPHGGGNHKGRKA